MNTQETSGQVRDAHAELKAALEQPAEPARPDIIERLTYHAHERDDLTLDDCLDVLATGWTRVPGRSERHLVLQILALLAGAPAAQQPAASGEQVPDVARAVTWLEMALIQTNAKATHQLINEALDVLKPATPGAALAERGGDHA